MALGFKTVPVGQGVPRYWGKVFLPLCLSLILLLTGCSLPQVSAESRLFLNLTATLVETDTLPQANFNDTVVGGFSALTYDAQQGRVYALVEDPVNPRFYTLHLNSKGPQSSPKGVSVEAVTSLKDPLKATLSKSAATFDGEGMILTRHGTAFVASGENLSLKIPPRLSEFELSHGDWQQTLPLPKQYWSLAPEGTLNLGVAPHRGLESLAINAEGDRLFVATEGPLLQDASQSYSRFLHYWIGEPEPILISEHLYPLDPSPADSTLQGLTDLVVLDGAGHFLSLERTYCPATGYGAVLYQLATGVATDTSGIRTLPSNLKGIVPILKKPLLNLAELNLPLQNLEGLTLGPRLQDGSRSLLLISNNQFDPAVPTQVLMLRLDQRSPQVKS